MVFKLTVLSYYFKIEVRKQRRNTKQHMHKIFKLVAQWSALFIHIGSLFYFVQNVVGILFVRRFFTQTHKKHPIIGLTTCIYYALRFCCCFSLIELDLAFWLSGFRTRASTHLMLYAKRIYV